MPTKRTNQRADSETKSWYEHVNKEMSEAFVHPHPSLSDCGLIIGLAILSIGLPALALYVLNWG